MGRLDKPLRIALSIIVPQLAMLVTITVKSSLGENLGQSSQKQPSPARKVLTVDEARMIVKEIPTVDIKGTLARWKLSEAELVQLRTWSAQLVENPARTDFLPKWRALIQQVSQRNAQIGNGEVTALIRMVMLAAYEAAQKYTDSTTDSAAAESTYRDLEQRLRASLTQARQLKALAVTERRDPTTGSQISVPAYQRTFQKCEVVEGPKPQLRCEDKVISTTPELEDFMANSEAAISKAEEKLKNPSSGPGNQSEKRRQILYSLSDVAKEMHDTAMYMLTGKRS